MYGFSRYGIKLSDLTFEVLRDIVKIYDETVGGRGSYFMRPGKEDDVRLSIISHGSKEFRYGSRFDRHSKLWIKATGYTLKDDCLIYFSFSANFDPRLWTEKNEEIAQQLRREFAETVDVYLEKKGIAVELMPKKSKTDEKRL